MASAYRSYEEQQLSHNRLLSVFGVGADSMSATPGHSQHQLGTAVDFTNGAAGYQVWAPFAQTSAYWWLEHHAWEYGFVLAYPRGKEEQTGYHWEPWHYRYVGVEDAKRLKRATEPARVSGACGNYSPLLKWVGHRPMGRRLPHREAGARPDGVCQLRRAAHLLGGEFRCSAAGNSVYAGRRPCPPLRPDARPWLLARSAGAQVRCRIGEVIPPVVVRVRWTLGECSNMLRARGYDSVALYLAAAP